MANLYILNQIYCTLVEWAATNNYKLPKESSLEKIVARGIQNIRDYLPHETIKIEIPSYKESLQYLKKDVIPIFVSPEIYFDFRKHLLNNHVEFYNLIVSRSRILSSDNTFFQGAGRLLGRGESLQDQIKTISNHVRGRPCMIFDDVIFSGGTFENLNNEFILQGMKIEGIVSVISRLSPKHTLCGREVISHHNTKTREDMIIEMKDFLAIPGSGAVYPKGVFEKRLTIKKILSVSLENTKDLTNEHCFKILENKNISGVDISVTSTGRLIYLFPGMHSKYWNITPEKWRDFSLLQLEISNELYQLIEDASQKNILIHEVGIFDEKGMDPNQRIVEYLQEIQKEIKDMRDN